MSRLMRMLCLVLSVSLVLTPMSRVHAHVSSEHRGLISVHGGHDHPLTDHGHDHSAPEDALMDDHHDHELGHDHESGSHAIDLNPDAVKPNAASAKSLVSMAILCVTVFSIPHVADIGAIRAPPRIRTRPPSPYPHALPLLRGPPSSI